VASVELRGLTRRYGTQAVVDNVSLTIPHGALVCLLGPSGCGKTTTLRLIAGFVEPSEGEILVAGRVEMGLSIINVGLGFYADEESTARNVNVKGDGWLDVIGIDSGLHAGRR